MMSFQPDTIFDRAIFVISRLEEMVDSFKKIQPNHIPPCSLEVPCKNELQADAIFQVVSAAFDAIMDNNDQLLSKISCLFNNGRFRVEVNGLKKNDNVPFKQIVETIKTLRKDIRSFVEKGMDDIGPLRTTVSIPIDSINDRKAVRFYNILNLFAASHGNTGDLSRKTNEFDNTYEIILPGNMKDIFLETEGKIPGERRRG